MAMLKDLLSEQKQFVNDPNLEFRIINAVKQHPVLYNTVDVNFRVNTAKEKNNAWDSVATEVGITAVEVRKGWKKLRDKYRVYLKRQKQVYKQKRPLFKNKVWKYHKEMQFLLPYMYIRTKLHFKCLPSADDVSIPNNNMMNDNLQASANEMAGSYSDIEDNVNNKVLYPHVELLCNFEPLYGVDENIKLPNESLTTTAVTETILSAKIKPDQLQSKQTLVNEMAGSSSAGSIENTVNNEFLYQNMEIICNDDLPYGFDEDVKLSDESLTITAVTEPVLSTKTKTDQLQSKQTFMNEMTGSSDIEDTVNNEFLYQNMELVCNDEPSYGVDENVKLSDESLTITAITETALPAKIKPNQPQSKQNQVKIVPTDIFFYSMSEATKNLPRIVQMDIQRKVLDVVNSIEKETNENKILI